MSFGRAILAAFIGGVLAGVFLLAYRVSKETEKSMPEALADVPAEARKIYDDVRDRASGAATKVTDAATKVTDAAGKVSEAAGKVGEAAAKGMDKLQHKAEEAQEGFEEAF